MGDNNSKCSLTPISHDILDYGYCKVWRSKLSKLEEMEEYSVNIKSPQHLHSFRNMWNLRSSNPNFVHAYSFSHRPTSQICTGFQKGTLMTERILYRLSQLTNIPYTEAVSILFKALQAYQVLYEHFGLFLVRSTMIGFNRRFELKFWCHTDMSQAEPENPYCNTLSSMINSIINCVHKVAAYSYGLDRFPEYTRKNKIRFSNFKNAIECLANYMKTRKIQALEKMPNIVKYLRSIQGEEELLTFNNMAQAPRIDSPYQKNANSAVYNHPNQLMYNHPTQFRNSLKDYCQNKEIPKVNKEITDTYYVDNSNNNSYFNSLLNRANRPSEKTKNNRPFHSLPSLTEASKIQPQNLLPCMPKGQKAILQDIGYKVIFNNQSPSMFRTQSGLACPSYSRLVYQGIPKETLQKQVSPKLVQFARQVESPKRKQIRSINPKYPQKVYCSSLHSSTSEDCSHRSSKKQEIPNTEHFRKSKHH